MPKASSRDEKIHDGEDLGRRRNSVSLRLLRQGFELEGLKQKRQRQEKYDKGGGWARLATSEVVGTGESIKCTYCKGVDRQNCMLKCANRACGCTYHAFCIPDAVREAIGEGIAFLKSKYFYHLVIHYLVFESFEL